MRRLLISLFTFAILHSSFFISNCLADTTWQAIGPFGGHVEAVAIDPNNSQTVYVGTLGGGVYKTTNGGASWAAANTGIPPSLRVPSLAIDPTNSQTLYAGTGGGGVYKTTNGGVSWTTASSGITDMNVSSLAIDATNSQTLYVGTLSAIFKSTNSGTSWTLVNSLMPNNVVFSIAIDPSNSQTIYAGTDISGVYKTTNGGASWTAANSGIPTSHSIRSLTIDPTDGQTVYAGTVTSTAGGSIGGGVFKSTDGGASWVQANNGMTDRAIASLAIDPTNSQTLYAGAGDGVFKSTNGSATWTNDNSGPNALVSCIIIDPSNSQTLYAGTWYGGIYKSTNGETSWTPINSGMTNTVVSSLVIDPTTSQTLYAGTEYSAVFKSTNSGASWTAPNTKLTGAAVYSLAIDPNNSQTIYAVTWNFGILKSTNGGISWTLSWINPEPERNTPNTAIAIDPNNSQTVYVGTPFDGVLKSTNGGASWTAANSGMVDNYVYSIVIDRSNSQTIYAGTLNNGVFKTTNGGASWTAVNTGIPTSASVLSLAIDPTNSQTLYAGINGVGIYKSTNGGASWANTSASGLVFYVRSLVIDPTNCKTLYAGTNNGLFKTTDAGVSWTAASSELNVVIRSVAIDPSDSQTVYVGTDKGVFKTFLSNDVPAITSATVTSFSEGSAGTFRIAASGWPPPQFSVSGSLPSGLSFDTATGLISGTPANGSAGTYSLVVTATNGIPPDATRGLTLAVLPATSLAVAITTPSSGAKPDSLMSITGTASGSSLSKVEVQITDGTYYLQSNGTFALTSAWMTATGTAAWSLNTSTVPWREGITYTIQARASDGTAASAASSSTFTIVVPTSKTGTILSMTLTSDTLRAGCSTIISGSLVKADTTTVSSQPVTLIITPPSTVADPNPALTIKSLTTDNAGAFTSGILSLFAVPGVYMVQARFEGDSTLAASFTSQVLGVTPKSGYAIIVTGKASDNSLLDMHTASTDTIYSILVNKRGFLPENIQYLKSTTLASVTRQQIQEAITTWARNKLIASPGPLYLIMIDHGSQSGFLLGPDTLTPDQLKGYLDTLESDPQVIGSGALTAYNRIIMVGSCYSGIFTKLSKPGRIIITSANTDEQSIAGFSIFNSGSNTTYYGGEYFIDALFSYLGRGDSLKDAFTQSSNMVELRDPRKVPPGTHAGVYDTLAQHPLMDDNGDNKASYILDTEGTLAANLRLGVGIRSLNNPADITAVTETTTIPVTRTNETPLWLRVNDNSRIAKAWMEIRTPITSVSSTSGSGQVIPHLITLPLYYDGLQWNGSYSFPNAGKYNILYYTQDNQTNDIAPAKNSVVYRQLASNTAPAGFTLTSPNDQEGVSGMFPLTWQEVTSPYKITYTLQVSDQNNNIVYKEENIPQAATYMPKDALKKTGTSQYYCQNGDSYCYWKVTAIDNYGATSTSNTRSFTIVSTNALPGIIKGTLRDATTGAPIAGATVTAGSSQDTSRSNGSFILMQPSGVYTVTATATGYQPKTLVNIALSSGAVYDASMSLEGIVTTLPGVITGYIRDAAIGTPIAGAMVTAINVSTNASSQFTTLSNGGFILMQQSGVYTVTVTATGYQTKTITNIALSSGAVYDAGMNLESNIPITFSVTPSAGSNGTISPTTAQTVNSGAIAAFTITPAGGYRTVTPVGGTCPQGTLIVDSYTTGAITGDCTVSASFTRTSTTGDLTGDGKADLVDAITALQVMSNITPPQTYTKEADVNGDGKIGHPEAMYILQKTTGVR